MAKPRALTQALFLGSLAAVSAMFACGGPGSSPYDTVGDAGGGTTLPDAPTSIDAPAPTRDGPVSVNWDASSYPLSRCSVGQDVFYLDVEGPSGPLQHGEITQTNSGTSWFVALQPELNVMLATPTGPVGSIQVWTPDSTPVVPGTYPQAASGSGTSIAVVVVEEPCHLSSGTLTVLDLQYNWPDGSPSGDVTSLLLTFDLMCGTDSLRGCVRYSQ